MLKNTFGFERWANFATFMLTVEIVELSVKGLSNMKLNLYTWYLFKRLAILFQSNIMQY